MKTWNGKMWVDHVQHCAPTVHEFTMKEVVRVESGGNPLSVHVNGLPANLQPHPGNTADAVAAAYHWIAAGYRVDLGLTQITDRNLAPLHRTVEQILGTDDEAVCANLAAGAYILTTDYSRAVAQFGEGQYALKAALSAYNTGTMDRGFANGYVARYDPVPGLPVKVTMAQNIVPIVNRHAADTEAW
jgi:type IV secretion system protein VirB1